MHAVCADQYGKRLAGHDIDTLPEHRHDGVAMTNNLTCLTTRNGVSKTVSNVVKAGLKLLQKQFAGNTGLVRSLLVVRAELRLEREIDALCLLLFAQLQAITNDLLCACLAVLARGEVALVDGALLTEATRTLEEQLNSITPAKTADSSCITCHL